MIDLVKFKQPEDKYYSIGALLPNGWVVPVRLLNYKKNYYPVIESAKEIPFPFKPVNK